MKKLFLLLMVLGFTAATSANALEYGFDKAHSRIGFSVKHFLTMVSGEFKDYDGTIDFDPASLQNAKVKVTIQASSIYTGIDKRDEHLKSEAFFDVEKYPTLVFVSKKVSKGSGDNEYEVEGDLTMHGVTKPVTLDVDYLGSDTTTMGKDQPINKIAGFSATAKIDRNDFGLTWGEDMLSAAGNKMISNDVTLQIDVAAQDKASLERPKAMKKDKPADQSTALPASSSSN